MDKMARQKGSPKGMLSPDVVRVSAGILERGDGFYLLARRPLSQSSSGFWEFPGGKQEPNESCLEALIRELNEELGIYVKTAYPLVTKYLEYAGGSIVLSFWRVTDWENEPKGIEGQQLFWQDRAKPVQVSPLLRSNVTIASALSRPHLTIVIDDSNSLTRFQKSAPSLGTAYQVLIKEQQLERLTEESLKNLDCPIIVDNKISDKEQKILTTYHWLDPSHKKLDPNHMREHWPEAPDMDHCFLLTKRPKKILTLPFVYYVPTHLPQIKEIEEVWNMGAWGTYFEFQ